MIYSYWLLVTDLELRGQRSIFYRENDSYFEKVPYKEKEKFRSKWSKMKNCHISDEKFFFSSKKGVAWQKKILLGRARSDIFPNLNQKRADKRFVDI